MLTTFLLAVVWIISTSSPLELSKSFPSLSLHGEMQELKERNELSIYVLFSCQNPRFWAWRSFFPWRSETFRDDFWSYPETKSLCAVFENFSKIIEKVWGNRFQNTGIIMIWGVCFWVLNIIKLQLTFSRNPRTYFW